MTLRVDSEKYEVRALEGVADWRGKRVVEIGCGKGRLTERLASLGASVEASDPNKEAIAAARDGLPNRFAERVRFTVGQAELLGYRDASFDTAVFAWSL
ncbi:MAG: class I SAM-dependent methyltransferase [bacterium]|nr:class I SAM-dependent methyltransferase [bacterium]